jgi:hypothetical protein
MDQKSTHNWTPSIPACFTSGVWCGVM